jgi:ferric-dicitrate binding protein FerR (iron transport regulator)
MIDPSHYPDSKPHATRRWVRVAVIIALVAALLVIVMLLIGGGGHGPGRHTAGGQTPTFSVTDDHAAFGGGVGGQTSPGGGHQG